MSDTYSIVLNGEERVIQPDTTIAVLLTELGLPETGIAVAVNMDVVPRSEHPNFVLHSGARVEVIRAVGGG